MFNRLFSQLTRRHAAAPPAESAQARGAREAATRAWLAADLFPAYAPGALAAEPLRLRVAGLIAAGTGLEVLEPLLDQLDVRGEAIDRMLRADALLAGGAAARAEPLLAELAMIEDGIGARAAALLAQRLMDRGDYAAARPLAGHAGRLTPDCAGTQAALGYLRDFDGREEQAQAHFRRALALRPDHAGVVGQLAAHLARNDFGEALALWALADEINHAYPQAHVCPVWDGRPLGGESLVILCNGGLGETVHFLRFAGVLRRREPAARLFIRVAPPLEGLVRATGWFEAVHTSTVDCTGFDWQVTQMRLPLALGVTGPEASDLEPYLQPDARQIANAAAWLLPRRPGVKRVGLRWCGLPAAHSGKRDIPFDALQPLFDVPGIEWVALVEQPAALEGLGAHPLLEVCAHLTGLDATGALLHHLDLVISADTAVAHLAGALGRPAWVLARPDAEFRWGARGAATPWYGAVRVFHHPPQQFDWGAVVRDVAQALRDWAAEPDPRDVLLRRWLAEEIAPGYAWDELLARPQRLEAARRLAEGVAPEGIEPLLEQLEAQGAQSVDRMLGADVLLRQGDLERALPLLDSLAAGTDASAARAAMLAGEVRYDHGEFAAAVALAERALQLAPESFGCLLLLGNVRNFQGRHQEALALFRRALAQRPQSLLAIGQLSVALMGCGALREGLQVYAAADDLLGAYPRADVCPVWRGEALGDKRLLVIGAYGYGDVMMFLRFVAQLREREPQVRLVIDVQPYLARLVHATGWFETVYEGVADRGAAEYQVSTMRLPLVLGTSEGDVPRHDPCLRIADADVAAAAAWLPPRRAGIKRVGLRWFGRPMHFDAKRSIPFAALAPLFAVPGLEWVALVEEAALLEGLGAHPLQDVSTHLVDFYATGALMEQLDLIISVDTSTVHLAGSLGRPTWLIARPDYEWRWGESGAQAPWYGSVRVFRHPPQGFDWGALVAQMERELRAWAAA